MYKILTALFQLLEEVEVFLCGCASGTLVFGHLAEAVEFLGCVCVCERESECICETI